MVGVDPQRLDEYKRYLDNIWPEISTALEQAGIRNFGDIPSWRLALQFLPITTYNIPAEVWVEAPQALLDAGADIGDPAIMYIRRIGPWLLWRAGPARKAHSWYVALHHEDLDRIHTFRIYPDGSGKGAGPKGIEHQRFRLWKEELNETS